MRLPEESSHLLLLPVQPQLGKPLEGVDVIAARPSQLIYDVPCVDLHGDQRHHLQAQDFGQTLPNHLQIALEQEELRTGGALRQNSKPKKLIFKWVSQRTCFFFIDLRALLSPFSLQAMRALVTSEVHWI